MENITPNTDFFTQIYNNNTWGGSGSGSYPGNTATYRDFLTNFLNKKNIKTVVDYGCGDWQFSKLIDWSNISYTGIDCVESVVQNNINNYTKDNITFKQLKTFEEFFTYKADLLLIKDVLQHWLNNEIIYFLDNVIKNFNYILITNSCDQQFDWQDEPERSRPLSCEFLPLKKYNCKKRAIITNDAGNKEISLISNV